jgi:glycosyltransferase involved in cell wall biosynthesis
MAKNNSDKKISILLVTKEFIGEKMNAMGIRYFEFAKFLSLKYEAVLLAPSFDALKGEHNFRFIKYTMGQLIINIYKSDILIVTNPHPLILFFANFFRKKIILDLYDPIPIENLELIDAFSMKKKIALYSIFISWVKIQIKYSHYYICANDRQKDFWLGFFAALGKLNPKSYSFGKEGEGLISLVATGLRDSTISRSRVALKKAIPSILDSDKVLIWAGAPNKWFDTRSLILAMSEVSKIRGDIKLVFMGGKAEKNNILKEDIKLSESLGLTGKIIYFINEWVPYDKVSDYYAGADMGISLHFLNLESRFSIRNRVIGYLGAGLPVIITEGDSLSCFVEKNELGIVIGEKNTDELVRAIIKLADDENFYEECRLNIEKITPAHRWASVLPELEKSIKFISTIKNRKTGIIIISLLTDSLVFFLKNIIFLLKYGRVTSNRNFF